MTFNEILSKQNVLNALLLKDGDNELSKELKVKIVRLRIAFSAIRKTFDEALQEFVKELAPERFKELQQKPEDQRTDEEKEEFEQLSAKINTDYNEFIIQKGNEEVTFTADDKFTDEEFDTLININAGNQVEINGNKIKAEELMEIFYTLFVNKN